MTVTESDRGALKPLVDPMNVPVYTLHWGTNLSKRYFPSIDELPKFSDRRGYVFVGFAENPTNRIALEWFFGEVYPILQQKHESALHFAVF